MSKEREALAELVACDEIRRTLRVDLNKDSFEEFRRRSNAAWERARAVLAEPDHHKGWGPNGMIQDGG